MIRWSKLLFILTIFSASPSFADGLADLHRYYELMKGITPETSNSEKGLPTFRKFLSAVEQKYLNDSAFLCQRPLLSLYFKAYFFEKHNISNLPDPESCDLKIGVNYAGLKSNFIRYKSLRETVAIHYVYAEPGTQMMSRFGHAMFRLIICNIKQDPACADSISNHSTFSFFGDVPAFEQGIENIAKGLTGQYPMNLYATSFVSSLNQYNSVELRDISSYPFNLNSAQKVRFLYAISEFNQIYRSSYYFLTQNCASETLRLLAAALPDIFHLNLLTIYRPDRLTAALLTVKTASGNLLNSNLPKAPPYFYRRTIPTELWQEILALSHSDEKYGTGLERKRIYDSWVGNSRVPDQSRQETIAVEVFVLKNLVQERWKAIFLKLKETQPRQFQALKKLIDDSKAVAGANLSSKTELQHSGEKKAFADLISIAESALGGEEATRWQVRIDESIKLKESL